MLLTLERPKTNCYPVEASGWDSEQTFFVEKCELAWDEETGKCIALSRSLGPGSIVFLRLLQPTSPDRSLPVAYHAESVGMTADGQQQFRLSQLQPMFGSMEHPE
jgi:hypothetical protein